MGIIGIVVVFQLRRKVDNYYFVREFKFIEYFKLSVDYVVL